jgi:predicted nucleic acid-binding protein
LHSLGVVTFRQAKPSLFMEFAQDMLPYLQLLSLPASDYVQLPVSSGELKLDFDDVYQYRLAKAYDLTLVTLDRDFRFVSDIQFQFL